jgi:hypothetical protein
MSRLLVAGCVLALTLAVLAQTGAAEDKIINGRTISSSGVSDDLFVLHDEYVAYMQSSPTSAFEPSASDIPVRGDRVVIDAAATGDAMALLASLQALGLQGGAVYGRMVSGELPIESIPKLEGLYGLTLIRPAYAATGVGLTTSQGDVALRAAAARTTFSVDGTGLTVGTLSDSYNCLGGAATDVTNNDLPAGVNLLQEINNCAGATDEGRGMMQLIHDIAPGAAQAFHSAFNGQADFAQGINDLAAANCDIICDDAFYFAEPFFQDGIIAQAVDNVVSMGIPYFALAGNHDRKSYEDDFRASGMNPVNLPLHNAHDFDSGAGTDIYQRVTIPNGARVVISLQWNQPFFSVSGAPGSANDVDLVLYDNPPTNILAFSSNNNVGGDPVEVLSYTNNTGQNQFNVAIARWIPGGGPLPGHMKYIVMVNGALNNFIFNEWGTTSSTVYGHMNSATGETVGAAFYDNTPAFGVTPPLRETFSSAGRTRILFDTAGNPVFVLRDKPNIMAVDGTNTTFFGSDIPDPGDGSDTDTFPNFFGTSAAAPHAAAVAALLMDAVPGLTPAQVYTTLETTAIDMDDPGWDANTGFGLIQTDAAICEWDQTPPVITCPSDVTVECVGTCGVPKTDPQLTAFFAGVSATDECTASPTITNDAPDCFPKGTTTVTFTATDDKLNSSTCTANVTVVDTTPPTIDVVLNRDVLWPPNHKMSDITATVTVSDVCCASPTFVLTSITSDEPDDGKGDGNTTGDIQDAVFGTTDTAFKLRSERMGGGDGRVYTIIYTATDCSGNSTPDTVYVRVPHDQDGEAFACTGYKVLTAGIGIDPSVDEVTLIVRSHPDIYGTDVNGNTVLLSPAFDASLLEVSKMYVGNEVSVTTPTRNLIIDNNADGLKDMAATYSADAINAVVAAYMPDAGDDYIDASSTPGAIGLHYTSATGIDYLVPNIFTLGDPVPLVPPITIGRGGAHPIGPTPDEPKVTALLPCYPNPFNPTTTIPFSLETQGNVSLRIYDAAGRVVRTLQDGALPAGPHSLMWDGRDDRGASAATGIYFVRLVTGSFETTQKIVLLK